jgi:pimeloyl-ACP methyl ester carboxylesterase
VKIGVAQGDITPFEPVWLVGFGSRDRSPMPGVGHFVMLEDQQTFNRLLEEAIGKLMETEVSK